MIVPIGSTVVSLSGANGKEEWKYAAKGWVASSPAVGDVDGDGNMDVVFGEGQDVVCLNAYTGKVRWRYATGASVYSSPALGSRHRSEPFRRDWPMFRHDAARTGFYGFAPGPLGIYIGSDDGYLHLIDGKSGERIDRYAVKFPDLIIVRSNYGPLKFLSSPSLADLDGNGTLEAVFSLVDRVWAVEDIASTIPMKEEPKPVTGKIETAKKNLTSPRNAFALAQVIHSGGWNPGVPIASKMLEELTKRAKLEVLPEMTPVSLRDDDVTRFPFLYLTGHDDVRLGDEEIRTLKGHLERGGFMFAEACCNSAGFEKSARALAAKLFGEGKLAKVPPSHPIFSKVYPIKAVSVKGVATAPAFEGVEVNGRLVFLFTAQDYGCSWGNTCCTSGCSGVAQEDSYRMMTNIAVQALTE